MGNNVRSSVPLHNQIAHVLKLRLEAGQWPAEAAPATERALCDEFGVSRTTVRMALEQLKQAGLLESRRGVGTRGIAAPVKRHVVGSSGNPLHASLDTRSRVVALGEIPSPSAVAGFFGIATGCPIWHFTRIHSLGDRPLSVVDSYLPVDIGKSFSRAALKEPLHDLLWRHFGLRQARSVHAIRVARADVDVAAMLRIALADPVLAIQSSIYLPDGKPIRWVQNSFKEDQYEYVAEMDWPEPATVHRAKRVRGRREPRRVSSASMAKEGAA